MELSDEKITLTDIPALGEGTPEKRPSKIFPTAVTFAAAVLIAASLAVHTVLIASAAKKCKEDGADILLSLILPKTETVKPESGEKTETDKAEKTPDAEGAVESGGKAAALPYISCDLSTNAENAMALMNETSYEPDLSALLNKKKPIESKETLVSRYGEDAPLVLIYHTHGTEAYSESAGEGFRSTDTSKNVVAVGTALAKRLEELGVGTVHLCDMFDLEDFSTAYDRSTVAVRKALKKYPSVRYILDIHRDYVDRDGEYVKCLSEVEGDSCAQLMFVCGTDEGGSGHDSWQDNLTVSLQLQSLLWQKYPSLMRPIDLKSASFYQDTGAGALIVEFGTCGNSLSEVLSSADIFAKTLSEYITK